MRRSGSSSATLRRRARQGGNALLELSLSLMGFLFLTLGTMEMGYAVYQYNFCSFAAQDAARWASVRGSQSATNLNCTSFAQGIADGCAANNADITTYVTGEAIGLDQSKVTVSTTWNPNSYPPVPGSEVSVKVSYSSLPLVGLAIQGLFTVSNTATNYVVH